MSQAVFLQGIKLCKNTMKINEERFYQQNCQTFLNVNEELRLEKKSLVLYLINMSNEPNEIIILIYL